MMKAKRHEQGKYKLLFPLLIVMGMMFLWNMCRNINDVLIPHLKRACRLTDVESSLVQSAFFGAYFLLALPAGMFIKKKGYKGGMVLGLLLASIGAALFYPAAETRYYPLFLGALFVMAAGFTFLETSATPYVAKLGNAEEASGRLSLAAAVGSCGAAFAPYAASLLLLHKNDINVSVIRSYTPGQLDAFLSAEASMVKLPYIFLAVLFLVAAFIVFRMQLPAIKDEADGQATKGLRGIFSYRHTLLGVLAVFCYVGAEVGIVSFMIRYAKSLNLPGLTERRSALFITSFMLLVLTGRLAGSYILKKTRPAQMLLISATGAAMLVTGALLTSGYCSIILLVFVGLFSSIMYPLIFTISISNVGAYTKIASSLLIMGIVGGAVGPPLMGWLSDHYKNIQIIFLLPLIFYLYVIYYALRSCKAAMAGKVVTCAEQTAAVEVV